MAGYKHAIWDWNGTLLDDGWLCVEVLNGLLARRGREPITEREYREHFGFPVIHFYDYLGFDTDKDSFERVSHEFIGDYERRWLDECVLHADTAAVLGELASRGIEHSVLSAAKQEALDLGIVHFGIRGFFNGLCGASDIYASGKVDRGRRWIETLNCAPDEVVLIGDTKHDYEVAEAIGADCILLAHGHQTAARLAETGAPVVHTLRELLERF